MKIKKVATALGITGGISYLAYRKISNDLFKNAFLRKDKVDEVDPKYLEWLSKSNVRQVRINSFDGLKLNAYNVANHQNKRYIILVHGIWSSKPFSYSRAYEFDKRGFNTLIIDQRSSGDSEGTYYTYGQKESLDLLLWINYLVSKDPDVQIILYGVSMGAATVMMSTANNLPDNVKCIIEDCGYSSMEEEFDYLIKHEYKIRYSKIVLSMIERQMIKNFGVKFEDVSPKKCLEENEIPIMFVHGEKDDFVPFEMAKKLYNHNKGVKKYYPIKDAGHTQGNTDLNYYDNIVDFINEYAH